MILIDADAFIENAEEMKKKFHIDADDVLEILDNTPTIEAVPAVYGEWILEAHKEPFNYRWNVTAQCSECYDDAKEIWAGFFPCVPDHLAKEVSIQCAESVPLSNFCPNCGADMREKV